MKSTVVLLFVTASTLAATAAFAQDAPAPTTNASNNGTGVQDIIVTAQRRAENVINVPLSIQAITGQTLANQNIQSFDQLNFTTPGFIVQNGTGYTEAFIRGIGNAVLVGADPSVATFIDDVPHVYGSLINDFVNVERIEVLKGAQGGLYGRNATGGVVNIITKQPSNKLEFEGRASYGSYQTLNTALYVNVPITDSIAWNFSATRNYHDSYLNNRAPSAPYVDNYPGDAGGMAFLNPGQPGQQKYSSHLNNGNVWSVDSKLRFQAGDHFKITLGADYTEKNDANGNGWISSDYGYNGPGNPLSGAAQAYDLYMHELLGNAGYAANANQIHHIETLFVNPGRGNAYMPYQPYAYTRDYGGSIRATYSLPTIDITNISAYRWDESRFQGDIGAAPVSMAGFQTHFLRKYFYQEDRIQNTDKGRLHFLGGVTYFQDRVDTRINGQFAGFTQPPTLSVVKTSSWSVYGQAGYDITDHLNLTGSLRYIHEKRDAAFPADPTDPVETGPESSSGTEHKLLPAVTLSYKTGEGTIYARWARGFKTGGVNPLVRPTRYQWFNYFDPTANSGAGAVVQHICAPGECTPNTTFGGETVDTYEIGWRTNLFDHRAQLTTAVFYNNYSNLQTVVGGNQYNPDVAFTYINAKKARTYGAEASLTVRVAKPLTVSAGVGYLNAKYTNFKFGGNSVVDGFDFSGNRMMLAPKWQGNIGASLDQPITERLNLVGNILASYTGKFFFTANNNPTAIQPSYWNVNLRLGVRSSDRRYGIFLDIENLFDKLYYVSGVTYQNPDSTFRADRVAGTPRVIKATLELKF